MKAYIVGTNLNKYTILNKISEYLNGEGISVEQVDWLSRKNITIDDISDGNVYIWVEIDALINHEALSMLVNKDDDKKTIVSNFALLMKSIKNSHVQDQKLNTEEAQTANEVQEEIKYDAVTVPAEKESSLRGIYVIIEEKEYYISKDDYNELYKLDEMLSKHGYKISSIAVEE